MTAAVQYAVAMADEDGDMMYAYRSASGISFDYRPEIARLFTTPAEAAAWRDQIGEPGLVVLPVGSS